MFKIWTDFFKLDAQEFAETFNEIPLEDMASLVLKKVLEAQAGQVGQPDEEALSGLTENVSGSQVPQGEPVGAAPTGAPLL